MDDLLGINGDTHPFPNASGDRTRITWPDGFYVSYEYDSAGRLSHVRANGTMLLAQYSYDAQGRLTGQYLSRDRPMAQQSC